MTTYTDHGYFDRNSYLVGLSDEYSVDIDAVEYLAEVLGPDEDFDRLVAALEDNARSRL